MTIGVLLILSALTCILGSMLSLRSWRAILHYSVLLPMTLGVFLGYAALYWYIVGMRDKYRPQIGCSVSKCTLIVFLTITLSVLCGCAVAGYYTPYAMPVALCALMLTVMFKERLGLIATAVNGFTMLLILGASLQGAEGIAPDMHYLIGTIANLLTAVFMIFLIGKRYSRVKLTWGTILLAAAMAPVAGIMAVIDYGFDPISTSVAGVQAFLGNLIAIGTFTILQPIYEICFRIWTDFKLAEICSVSQPLLKQMKEEAPGSFNHSLTVANLAESCAMAIGLNPYMARACAYFHDVGKIKNPLCFIENQQGGYNMHDELIPEVSASMIARHTKSGVEILNKHRMPEEVVRAANEHHGTTPLMFFYLKAKGITEGELDINQFRYEGPIPSTKYSAIIMICDICEAMTRANRPESEEQLEKIVAGVIKDKLLDGQFDNCDLTVRDMSTIRDTICSVIPSIQHQRIDYDKAKERR